LNAREVRSISRFDPGGPIYHGERFNGVTHLAGTVLAATGAGALIWVSAALGDPWRIVSFSV
jgi:hemolysin III